MQMLYFTLSPAINELVLDFTSFNFFFQWIHCWHHTSSLWLMTNHHLLGKNFCNKLHKQRNWVYVWFNMALIGCSTKMSIASILKVILWSGFNWKKITSIIFNCCCLLQYTTSFKCFFEKLQWWTHQIHAFNFQVWVLLVKYRPHRILSFEIIVSQFFL